MPRLNVSRQRRAPVRKRSHVTARATGTPRTPAIARQQPGATLSRLRLFVRPSLPTPRKTGMLRRPQPSTRQKACFAAMSLRECESGGWCPPLRDRKATPCRGRGRWRNSIKAGCLSPSYRQAQCEIETGPAACAPLVGGWGGSRARVNTLRRQMGRGRAFFKSSVTPRAIRASGKTPAREGCLPPALPEHSVHLVSMLRRYQPQRARVLLQFMAENMPMLPGLYAPRV